MPTGLTKNLIQGQEQGSRASDNPQARETPREMLHRVTDAKSRPQGRIMVINDEAHHCHRDVTVRTDSTLTRWFRGIKHLDEAKRLSYVADLSATPIHMDRKRDLMEWITSDYSLVDAIEAGLVKIPQAPAMGQQNTDSRDLRVEFRDIYGNTDKKQQTHFDPADETNNPLLKDAFKLLAEQHDRLTKDWALQDRNAYVKEAAGDPDTDAPAPAGRRPVYAIVMNSVSTANSMFDWVSKGDAGAPLLSNYELTAPGEPKRLRKTPRTILLHSRIEEEKDATSKEINQSIRELAELYRNNPGYGFTKADSAAAILRRVMNTIGKPGQPGEDVRCVISVEMLTEGWDARTVTHLLGYRAFDSALLCEQVAGRTLRRVTFDFDETGQRLLPEYAAILGIPFPQYEQVVREPKCQQCGKLRKDCSCIQPAEVQIRVDTTRPDLALEWPNITELVQRGGQHAASLVSMVPKDMTEITPEKITARNNGHVHLQGWVGPDSVLRSKNKASRDEFIYRTASQAVTELRQDWEREAKRNGSHDLQEKTAQADRTTLQNGALFRQAAGILKDLIDCNRLTGPIDRASWPGDAESIGKAAQWLIGQTDIKKANPQARPVFDAKASDNQLWLSTDQLREYTALQKANLVYGPTLKCPITYAHCDSGWEYQVAEQLDKMREISRWTRNKNLNWHIPYVYEGGAHRYIPDFLAVAPLSDEKELYLVIEVKGRESDADRVKRRWAENYWIPAVNQHPNFGHKRTWDYLYLDSLEGIAEAAHLIAEKVKEHQDAVQERVTTNAVTA